MSEHRKSASRLDGRQGLSGFALKGIVSASLFGIALVVAAPNVGAQVTQGVTAGSGELPLVLPASTPVGILGSPAAIQADFEMELNAFQRRMVMNVMQMADSLNMFNLAGVERFASTPFYIDNTVARNSAELQSAIRQWFPINELDGYREGNRWPIERVLFETVEDALQNREVVETAYKPILDQLGMGAQDHIITVHYNDNRFVNENDVLFEQVFFVRTEGTDTRVAGIFSYPP